MTFNKRNMVLSLLSAVVCPFAWCLAVFCQPAGKEGGGRRDVEASARREDQRLFSIMCVHRTFSGPGLEAQVIYLAVHLLLRGFLFCVLGSGQCAMVVWDAGSRVDGATQGGGYRLCSCSTGLITPLKKERRLAHPPPHYECVLAYPCITLRSLTGPPRGFHPALCLIISDEQRYVLAEVRLRVAFSMGAMPAQCRNRYLDGTEILLIPISKKY